MKKITPAISSISRPTIEQEDEVEELLSKIRERRESSGSRITVHPTGRHP